MALAEPALVTKSSSCVLDSQSEPFIHARNSERSQYSYYSWHAEFSLRCA
jgi:hypothetical protein